MDWGARDEEPEETAARLDEAYRPWVAGLTAEQRAAILAWQGRDRRYEAIQSVFREAAAAPAETRDVIVALRDSIRRSRLPEDVVGWKGIRSVRRAFGCSVSDLRVGRTLSYRGFFAFTLDRTVATPHFTHPPGPPTAALLRMCWPAGTQVAWIAGAGTAELRAQYELLAGPGLSIRVIGLTYPDEQDALPEITVEVMIR